MASDPKFRVRIADWKAMQPVLHRIRTVVFVDGQKVPPAIESDGRDAECAHVVAELPGGEAIGTGRLMPDGRIGRMAVLEAWRNRGVGGAMLAALMQEAKRLGHSEVYLHSQSHAQAFYLRHGYVVEGEEYFEAGIPHIGMRAKL